MKIECTVKELKKLITSNEDASDVTINRIFSDGKQISEEII